MKPVPKYPSLLAVLGISDDGDAEPVIAADVDDLVAAMLTRPMEWQGYGV